MSEEDVQRALGALEACCNPASGEVIPSPFRLSGFLLCNVPIVATMLFTKSVYVQVGRWDVRCVALFLIIAGEHICTGSVAPVD